MAIFIQHKKNSVANTDRGPSPAIWADCDPLLYADQPEKGIIFFDEFLNFSQHISDQDTQQYSTYIDTGVTIQLVPDNEFGVLEIAGNDADNDEGSITTGGNKAGMVKFTDASKKKIWFEARLRNVTSVADDRLAFFIGLAEEGLAAADTLVDDTGALADKDYVGFRVLHADGDGLDCVHNTAGGGGETIVTESADGLAAQTLVADTYVKVGLTYDPANDIVLYWINGQRVDLDGVDPGATNFPDGEELALLLATKVGAATETKLEMDWWRLAKEI